jgi:hypothetical protein
MLLPTEAGIINPYLFLKGKYLQIFEEIPKEIPYIIELSKRIIRYFNVNPQNLYKIKFKF